MRNGDIVGYAIVSVVHESTDVCVALSNGLFVSGNALAHILATAFLICVVPAVPPCLSLVSFPSQRKMQ
jgi:hypothetical protein